DKLVGNGDMLYKSLGASKLRRTQGAYLSEKEIQRVIDHVVQQGKAEFNEALTKCSIEGLPDDNTADKLYEQAVEMVLTKQRGSTTFLQRQLGIGYTRASRLIEAMEEQGLVGPHVGSKQRDVYYTFEQYQDLLKKAMEDKQGSGDEAEDSNPGTEEPGGEQDPEEPGDQPDQEQ
ncbi:MAG: DNA translocase FtsK, partial [Planctomycetota bacterium]|nr:DNA translocase FtsK [Planctomycetota bacterium]